MSHFSFWPNAFHGLDFLFTGLLTGGLLFKVFIMPAGGPQAGSLDRWDLARVRIYGLAAFSTSFAWLVFKGNEISEVRSWVGIQSVIVGTSFGHKMILRLALLVGVSVLLRLRHLSVAAFLSLLLPFSSSLMGHASAQLTFSWLDIGIDYIHFLCVSFWTGGVVALWFWLGQCIFKKYSINILDVVKRFSKAAVAATAGIVGAGLSLAWRYGVPFSAPWQSDYGRWLLVKAGLFIMALIFASVNHFLHLKRWDTSQSLISAGKIRREIGSEMLLIVLVYIVAGLLTGTALP